MKFKKLLCELDIFFAKTFPIPMGFVLWVKDGKIKTVTVSINHLLSLENERLVKLTKGCSDPITIRRLLLELRETW